MTFNAALNNVKSMIHPAVNTSIGGEYEDTMKTPPGEVACSPG